MTIAAYDDLNPSEEETAKTSKFILATPEYIAKGIPEGFEAIPFSQLQSVIKGRSGQYSHRRYSDSKSRRRRKLAHGRSLKRRLSSTDRLQRRCTFRFR